MTTWRRLPPVVGVSPGDHGEQRRIDWLVEAATRGGLTMLVLREPLLDRQAYVDLARRLAPWLGEGLVLHGKHPDALALAESAGWGLHLPAGADLRAARARVKGLLGASCHTALDLAAARVARCDYAFVSPVYHPTSKADDDRHPLGIRGLADLCHAVDMPVVALGGITAGRVSACRTAGAAAIAVLGALFPPGAVAEDCEKAARALFEAWGPVARS